MKIFTPVSLVLLAAIMESSALDCYVCGPENQRCADPAGFIPYTAKFTTCVTAIAETKDGKIAVARDGLYDVQTSEDECYTGEVVTHDMKLQNSSGFSSLNKNLKDYDKVTYCYCNKNLCNGKLPTTITTVLARNVTYELLLQKGVVRSKESCAGIWCGKFQVCIGYAEKCGASANAGTMAIFLASSLFLQRLLQ